MKMLIALLVLACSTYGYSDNVDLYVISGQSNGFESRVEPEYNIDVELTQVHTDIKYSYYDMYYNSIMTWNYLRPRPLYSPSPGIGIGIEMSFGLSVNDSSTNPIAIIKAWRGGADLDEDFNPQAVSGVMAYTPLINYVNQRILELENQGHVVNLEGFVWIQGESDAAEGVEQSERYGDNLANFISSIRTDFNEPTLPFIYNQLNIGVDYADKEGVRQGQEWVAQNIPNVAMINVDDVQLGPDTHHYGVESKIEIGYRFADAIINKIDGDIDGDGFVGIADLNIVLGSWNQGYPSLSDVSGDGFVGIEDLNIVLGNWNAGAPPTASIIPEPGTLLLLGCGFLAVSRCFMGH